MPTNQLLQVGRGVLLRGSPATLDVQGRNRRTYGHDKKERRCHPEGASKSGFASAPATRALRLCYGAGVDWFVVQKALKVVGEFFRSLVTARRLFLQAFQADGFQILRHRWLNQSRRGRLVLGDLQERALERFSQKWRAARKQVVKNRAQRVNV